MKKIIRFTAALLAMAAMLICFVPQGSAPVRAADSLDDLYKQLQDILKQQADYDALINSTQGELAEIEVQVNQLSGEIQLYEDKIQIYADIIAGLDAQIAELEASIAKNEEDLQAYYKIYFERVRLNYEQGQTTYLEVLLGAGSFTDYLTRLDVVEQIMAYDNNLIKLMQDTIETIRTQKAKVEEKRAENQAAKDELTAQQDKLVALRSQAQAMASEMNDRIARYEAEKEDRRSHQSGQSLCGRQLYLADAGDHLDHLALWLPDRSFHGRNALPRGDRHRRALWHGAARDQLGHGGDRGLRGRGRLLHCHRPRRRHFLAVLSFVGPVCGGGADGGARRGDRAHRQLRLCHDRPASAL